MEDLSKVQQQNGHGDHMLRCNPEFCHNQSKTAFALGKTEFPLYFHPVADIGILQLSVDDGAFFRSPQCRAGEADSALFVVAQVCPVSIDFIRQNTLRITTLSVFVSFDFFLQAGRFIVGVERLFLKPDETADNADIQLGTEFHRSPGLSPNDRAHIQLTQTDDAIRHRMSFVVVHEFLLFIQGPDRFQTLLFPVTEIFSRRQHPIHYPEVTFQISQLLSDRSANLFPGFLPAACEFQMCASFR